MIREKLRTLVKEYSERNRRNNCSAVYSVTNSHGFMPSIDYFFKEVFSKDLSTYKIVRRGMIAYNPSRINVGSVAVQRAKETVIVSPLYVVFSVDENKMLPEFLTYFLHSDTGLQQIAAHTSGSVRDSLKFGALQDIEINLYSIEEQREIIAKLQKVDDLLECQRTVLKRLDDLVKSQFIEMFGNIGEDTKGWGLVALDECCELNPKKSREVRLKAGIEVSFIPMPAVSEDGVIDCSVVKQYEQVQTGFTYFAENDVLFAKITPCMENGKGAIARGLKNGLGFGSTEFHILRPLNGVCNPAWLYALTTFTKFRHDAAKKMTGSAGQRRVPASFLATYKVSVPPIELQNKFAAFVEQTDKSKVLMERCIFLINTLRKVEKTKGICYNIASKEVV